jgi:Domain of unknown function (DUF4839)
MVDDDVQYEFKSTKAIRGTEARAIAKWQKDGWQLVDQSTGTLHTTLNFRRGKPKVPWVPIAAGGGVVLLLAIVGGIISALHGPDDKAPAASKPAAVATGVPSETPRRGASESGQSGAKQILTPENNRELAALLAVSDHCNEKIEPFAAKYGERTIEFDGSIAAMVNHDDYRTRFDILLSPEDEGPESTRGPAFKFENVNVFDLHLTGANVPGAVGTGDLVHLVAQVGEYNAKQCLFFLEPVTTRLR